MQHQDHLGRNADDRADPGNCDRGEEPSLQQKQSFLQLPSQIKVKGPSLADLGANR